MRTSIYVRTRVWDTKQWTIFDVFLCVFIGILCRDFRSNISTTTAAAKNVCFCFCFFPKSDSHSIVRLTVCLHIYIYSCARNYMLDMEPSEIVWMYQNNEPQREMMEYWLNWAVRLALVTNVRSVLIVAAFFRLNAKVSAFMKLTR